MSETPTCTCLSISRDPLCQYHGDIDKIAEPAPEPTYEPCGIEVEVGSGKGGYPCHEQKGRCPIHNLGAVRVLPTMKDSCSSPMLSVSNSTPEPTGEGPKRIDAGFLRGVVSSTTSYSEGWREICARLMWTEAQLAERDQTMARLTQERDAESKSAHKWMIDFGISCAKFERERRGREQAEAEVARLTQERDEFERDLGARTHDRDNWRRWYRQAEAEALRYREALEKIGSCDRDDAGKSCCPVCYFVAIDGVQNHDSKCLIRAALTAPPPPEVKP